MRRAHVRRAVRADIGPAQIVRDDEYDVWTLTVAVLCVAQRGWHARNCQHCDDQRAHDTSANRFESQHKEGESVCTQIPVDGFDELLRSPETARRAVAPVVVKRRFRGLDLLERHAVRRSCP